MPEALSQTIQTVSLWVGLITGLGTVIGWVVLVRTKGRHIASRTRPKGAWERVQALSALTTISDDKYISVMASTAARAAAEAEAFTAVERPVRVPTVLGGIYLGIAVLAFKPSFDLGTLLVGATGTVAFTVIAAVHLAQNQGDRISIRTLVNNEDAEILIDPLSALRKHKNNGYPGNGADARIILHALRYRVRKLSDEKEAIKLRTASLDARETALAQREDQPHQGETADPNKPRKEQRKEAQ